MTPPHSLALLALFALLPACSTSPSTSGDADGVGSLRPADPGHEDDGAPGSDDGSDDGTGTGDGTGDGSGDGAGDGAGDGTDDPGSTPTPGTPIRFIALGDAGTGSSDQFDVADTAAAVCAELGCDFALYLGDNFYSDGVTSVDDSAWQDKFEQPYSPLEIPFYAVLGNHDYGGNGGGMEDDRANAQVEYALQSDKYRMPATYYSHVQGDVTFFGLDTTKLDWSITEEQAAWLPGALASANTTWKIGYGHHPYVSNGSHGNANDNFGPFFEDNLCGQVDIYFSGHDHHLEWLQETCGTEFIISGAGAKLYDVGGDNPDHFLESTLGFIWVEIVDRTFTGVFYDVEGNELYRRSFTK